MWKINGSVVFKHENEEFMFLKEEAVCMKKYFRDYLKSDSVEFVTKCSHKQVQAFFNFLKSGEVTNDFEDQIQVFELLREWDCHFSLFDSFRMRVQSQGKNGIMIHDGVEFSFNKGCLYLYSNIYQNFVYSNPDEVFHLKFPCSNEVVDIFLNLIHFKIHNPKIDNWSDLLDLCYYLDCKSLSSMFNEKSNELILSKIIKEQNEDHFNSEFYENLIIMNLDSFVMFPGFCQVDLPLLCRVFQKSEKKLSFNQIKDFITRLFMTYKPNAFILLSYIKITPNNYEFSHFLSEFMSSNPMDLITSLHSKIETLTSELAKSDKKVFELSQQVLVQSIDNLTKVKDIPSLISTTNTNSSLVNGKNPEVFTRIDNEIINRTDPKWKSQKPLDFEENIFIASETGKIDSVMYLLAKGNPINQTFDSAKYDNWIMEGSTALHFSSRYGQTIIVQYLIVNGAIVNSMNKLSNTPLHYAVKNNHHDIVKYLIEHGADVNATNQDCITPLHNSSENGNYKITRLLLEHGADTSIVSNGNPSGTPLHIAIENGYRIVIKVLIDNGADINSKDANHSISQIIQRLFIMQ